MNKVRMMCLYQQGAFSRTDKSALSKRIDAIYHRYFHSAPKVMLIWVAIPRGQSYIAGQPSSATTLTLNVPNGTADTLRHPLMKEICSEWMTYTNCNQNQVILSVMDDDLASQFTAYSLARIAVNRRKRTLCRLIIKMLLKRAITGHFSITTNLR